MKLEIPEFPRHVFLVRITRRTLRGCSETASDEDSLGYEGELGFPNNWSIKRICLCATGGLVTRDVEIGAYARDGAPTSREDGDQAARRVLTGNC